MSKQSEAEVKGMPYKQTRTSGFADTTKAKTEVPEAEVVALPGDSGKEA